MKVNIKTNWESSMQFKATSEDNNSVLMDAKSDQGGDDRGQTPAELLVSAVAGCMGISMMMALKNYDQPINEFTIDAVAEKTDGVPNRVEDIHLVIDIKTEIPKKVIERVTKLAHEKYCTISNSLSTELSYDLNYNED